MEHPLVSLVLDQAWRLTFSMELWLLIVLIAVGVGVYLIVLRPGVFGGLLGGQLLIDEVELGIGSHKIKLRRDQTEVVPENRTVV